MNNDLISRAALLEKVRLCKESVSACANHDYLVGYASALSGVEGQIAIEPAVDAEPVRCGGWEFTPTSNGYRMRYVGDDKKQPPELRREDGLERR